jgi:hypothetical protein
LLFAGATVFGQTIAGQFFTAWQVDATGLKLPYLTVSFSARWRRARALPRPRYLAFSAISSAGVPCWCCRLSGRHRAHLWVFTVPGETTFWLNVGIIVLLNLFSGAFWSGVGLAQFNLLLGLAPPTGRGTYSAVFAALTGITGAVAPILGGAFMAAFETVRIPIIGGLELNNYKLLFLLTGLIRLGCVFLLSGVKESDARSARYVLNQLAGGARRPLTSFLTLRQLGPSCERVRASAGGQRARRDPLPACRRRACPRPRRRLSGGAGARRPRAWEIRDPRAVPALVAKLSDPAADIGEIAADALGTIGHESATAALMTAAEGPDAGVRVAALRALARIADPNCAPVLRRALPRSPSTCEAASVALVAIAPRLPHEGRNRDAPYLLDLLQPNIDRGMRLTAARALRALIVRLPPEQSAAAYRSLCLHLTNETDGAVLAQIAGATVATGKASGASAAALTQTLLPLLRHQAIHGLAYAQLLQAIAEIGLEPGVFYPYLGLTDSARDETVSRLLGEMRRRAPPTLAPLSTAPSPPIPPASTPTA